MATPHKCPVCNGTGLVSRPPGVAGDTGSYTITSDNPGPFTCKACLGKCIIWESDPVYIPSVWTHPSDDLGKLEVGDVYVGDPGTTYTITTSDGTTLQEDDIFDSIKEK